MDVASINFTAIGNGLLLAALVFGIFFEVTPFKINPISSLMEFLLRSVRKEVSDMQENITKEMGELKTQDSKLEQLLNSIIEEQDKREFAHCRWEILAFANSLNNGQLYTEQEYQHIRESIACYNKLHEKYKFANGYTDDAIKRITDHHTEYKDSNLKYF